MEYRWQVLFAFDKTRDQNSPSILDLLNLDRGVAAGIRHKENLILISAQARAILQKRDEQFLY